MRWTIREVKTRQFAFELKQKPTKQAVEQARAASIDEDNDFERLKAILIPALETYPEARPCIIHLINQLADEETK